MHLSVERNIIFLSFLLWPLLVSAPAEADNCVRLDDGRTIRRAIDDDATIVISSHGTYAYCEVSQHAQRPALTVFFEAQSAAVPETDRAALEALMRQAAEGHNKVEIVARAFSIDDPSFAARLAHSRAAALRNMLLEFGATPDQLQVRAFGARQGKDRVDIDLVAPARGQPPHA
jgi:hypothetical protein